MATSSSSHAKIERSGLWQAVDGRVLIYIHKERELDEIEKRYSADHYVMVDDKLRILTALEGNLGRAPDDGFPRQGCFALDPQLATYHPAEISIERIGDLLQCDLAILLAAAGGSATSSCMADSRRQLS